MNKPEKFETTFRIASYETDLFGKMSLFALFNRFQDLAGDHASLLNVGYDLLRESRLAWVLSRIKLKILSLPNWGDNVHLATWPKGIDRLFALRDFCMKSEKGETLVLATTAWLLIDIDKNRPKRIENLPVDLEYPGSSHAIEEIPGKIQMPADLVKVFEKPIWLSDIDTNLHVNNAQYAKWIGNCFSENQFRTRRLASMQINFLEETLLDDTIELLKLPKDDLAGDYFVCGRSRKKETIVFHSQVMWL